MDLYTGVLEVIDMRSFTSIWYWIVIAVVWSTTSHWILGVPYDMVTRAKKNEGQAQQDLEQLITINCNRVLNIMNVAGAWVVGFSTFFITVLAVLGFWYDIEISQAVFLIVAPLSLVAMQSVGAARRLRTTAPTGIDLRRKLMRQRLFHQLIGMISIFVTAFWGMWHNLGATVL